MFDFEHGEYKNMVGPENDDKLCIWMALILVNISFTQENVSRVHYWKDSHSKTLSIFKINFAM